MVVGINIIKQALSRLNGGEFQVFCEQYLALNGYSFVSSKGGVPGTTITKPGTPDHICISADGHYIFIEDTTQKSNGLKEKLLEDIDKCIINPMHNLPVNAIENLFFCYNQELNDESIIEECRSICNSKNICFVFIGLELIANDLLNHPIKYSRLAESFLNLRISWYGVLSIEEFVNQKEKIHSSFSLANTFFGRRLEIDNAIDCIRNGESVILYGNPGTGKTRIAIEVCKALEPEYSTICINGYSTVSVEDLLEAIESIQSNQIIIFIDDANEFFHLDAIKDVKAHSEKIIVFMLSVRNYAKLVVEDKMNSFTTSRGIRLDSFSREETKEFLNNSFNIRNPQYINAIFRLSKGNSRLIVLASKLAIEKQNLNSIADATSLYNVYYGLFLDTLGLNNDQMIVLGLVAYENRIYLKELNYLVPIFQEMGFSSNSFIRECRTLEKAELLEINKDVVYYLDQSFKCFIQKKVFIDDKIISLRMIVKKLFFIHPDNTKSVINSILSIFQNEDISRFISEEIQSIADEKEVQGNSLYVDFLSFFGPFFPMRVMKHVLRMMDRIGTCSLEDCKVLIRILESFVDSDQIIDAVELLFRIVNERNELFESISQVLNTSFSFKYYSKNYGYCTQKAILEKMEGVIQSPTLVELALIKSAIPELLKTHFHCTESGDTVKEIRIIQFELQYDEQLSELRAMAWRILFSLQDFASVIEDVLLDYARDSYNSEFDERIGAADWTHIIEYISKSFDKQNLKHCVIVEHLVDRIPSISDSNVVSPFLSSKCFLIYKSLESIMDSIRYYDYEHIILPESFIAMIKDYDINDYVFLFKTISEIKKIKTLRQPQHIIPSIFNYIEGKGGIDLLELVNYCVSIGIIEEPFLIYALQSVLARHYSDYDLLSFIDSIGKEHFNNWMWTYYASKTESQIDDSVLEGFYSFLGTPDQNINVIGLRSITNLVQYKNYDSLFIFKCLSIIDKNFKLAPFMYSSYLREFFLKEPSQVVEFFNNDYSLLFRCYCNLICDNSGIEDYDGQLLAYASCLDRNFLVYYLEFIRHNEQRIRNPYERLQSLWNTSTYIDFADYIYCFAKEIHDHYKLNSLFNQFIDNTRFEVGSKEEIKERIKNWFFHLVDENRNDKNEIQLIAGLFEFIPLELRPDCIVHFLSICDDISVFKTIELVPFYSSWSGSKIPMLNERITYLENLKQRINQPKYLMHRVIIDDYIRYYRQDIRESEIKELMEEWN